MKKRVLPFIVVLPMAVSCIKGSNQSSEIINEYPEERKKSEGPRGECYVVFAGNPPNYEEVSCRKPIRQEDGSCLVPVKGNPKKKIMIHCE